MHVTVGMWVVAAGVHGSSYRVRFTISQSMMILGLFHPEKMSKKAVSNVEIRQATSLGDSIMQCTFPIDHVMDRLKPDLG